MIHAHLRPLPGWDGARSIDLAAPVSEIEMPEPLQARAMFDPNPQPPELDRPAWGSRRFRLVRLEATKVVINPELQAAEGLIWRTAWEGWAEYDEVPR